jgi:opacity protein-like surface antigen
MKIARFLAVALLAASASLSAQDDQSGYKAYVSIGPALSPVGHTKQMTHTTYNGISSFAAEAGLTFYLPGTGVQVRPNVGHVRMWGDDPGTVAANIYERVYNVRAWYIGFDAVYSPYESLPLSFTTGPSIHSWDVDVATPGDKWLANQQHNGMKLGWRIGANYQITDAWGVSMEFTIAEWKNDTRLSDPDVAGGALGIYVPGFNPSRPAYLTIKASYTF